MSDNTKIEWTDATWTPVRAVARDTGKTGWHCEHVSPGCAAIDIVLDERMLLTPLRWRRPRKVIVCSMTDMFADFVSDAMIDRMFAVMALCPQHVFQVLTKRSARMRAYFADPQVMDRRIEAVRALNRMSVGRPCTPDAILLGYPLPNVWLGVSVEDQTRAAERIPDLLATSAAVRWISAEPLLGQVDLTRICLVPKRASSPRAGIHIDPLRGRYVESGIEYTGDWDISKDYPANATPVTLDWVVAGGERGPGARPMHPDWARSLRDQCAAADVTFLFRQWGNHLPAGQIAAITGLWNPSCGSTLHTTKKNAGRLLDGVLHDGYPA